MATPLVVQAQATVTLVMTDSVATEAGPTTAELTLTRTGPTTSPLTVFMSATGSAIYTFDFTGSGSNFVAFSSASYRMIIPIGQSSASALVTPKQDNLIEGLESLTFSISANSNYEVGSASSDSFTIADDVAEVTLEMTDAQAGEAGATTATFVLRRTDQGRVASPLIVNLAGAGTASYTADFTGAGSGFVAFSGSLFRMTIPANALMATVTLTVKQDNRIEGQEAFTFTVAQPAVVGNEYTIGSQGSGRFTIEDDVAHVTLEMTDAEATEYGPTTATLVVRRTDQGRVASPLTVYLSGSGTAAYTADFTGSGGNFVAFSGTSFRVIITGNQLEASVTLTPRQDPIDDGELDEEFTFSVAPWSAVNNEYRAGSPSSDRFIIRDYGPGVFKDDFEPLTAMSRSHSVSD